MGAGAILDDFAAPERRKGAATLAGSLFALGIGEELWQSFVPAYLRALGGGGAVVGAYGSCRDLLDAAYQLPGGWLSDRWGPSAALRVFTLVAVAGYAIFAAAWTWPLVFAGLAATMAWKAAAFPATFALIGESLAPGRRIGGFTVQSLAVRLPRVIAAPIGGWLMWRIGLVPGVRAGAAAAVLLGICVIAAQWRGFDSSRRSIAATAAAAPLSLSPSLRRLLSAECLVRVGEAVAASFIVLYVTEVRHVSLARFGLLYATQQAVSLALYVPAARLAALFGSRALIATTFLFFAAFPVAVLASSDGLGLFAAFVVGGFKEIGEPIRKAAIVDMCRPATCAREVGAYYSVRNLLVVPGGFIGGLLWQRSPSLVMVTAAAISALGLLLFMVSPPRHVCLR